MDGSIKLCDFGSATTQCFQPGPAWSANQRALLEEEVSLHPYIASSKVMYVTLML
jgi:cyclin G-associated kinase